MFHRDSLLQPDFTPLFRAHRKELGGRCRKLVFRKNRRCHKKHSSFPSMRSTGPVSDHSTVNSTSPIVSPLLRHISHPHYNPTTTPPFTQTSKPAQHPLLSFFVNTHLPQRMIAPVTGRVLSLSLDVSLCRLNGRFMFPSCYMRSWSS